MVQISESEVNSENETIFELIWSAAPDDLLTVLYVVGGFLIVAAGVVLLIKAYNAEQVTFRGWKIKFSDRRTQELSQLVNRQRSVIFLATLFVKDFTSIVCGQGQGDVKTLSKVVLEGIPTALSVSGTVRRAVLLPKPTDPMVLSTYVHAGYSTDGANKMKFDSKTCAGVAFSTGETYYVPDKSKNQHFQPFPSARHKYSSIVNVPIKDDTGILGVLVVDAEPVNAFSEDDIEHLETFAVHLALLLRLQDIVDKGRRLARESG